jgi:hypothetical protein
MINRNCLILAPSTAGKTFFVRSNPGRARDGDVLIHEKTGWPPGRWWEDGVLRVRTNVTNALTLSSSDIGPPILVNIDPDCISDYLFERVVVAIPPMSVLATNAIRRRDAHPDTLQPTDLHEINRNCNILMHAAQQRKWSVADSIESAVSHIETFLRYKRSN